MPDRLEPRPANRKAKLPLGRLITQASPDSGRRGLLVKTLLLSGPRVSELVSIRVDDFYLDEVASDAGIIKRVYLPFLRHTVAQRRWPTR
jgi:integrase